MRSGVREMALSWCFPTTIISRLSSDIACCCRGKSKKWRRKNVIMWSEEILIEKKCNDRMGRNIGVNTMMLCRYPDGHGQSSLNHSSSQWRKTSVKEKKSEWGATRSKKSSLSYAKHFQWRFLESNVDQDAFVVMGSQNHPLATFLLVLLHTSTGFTEKGESFVICWMICDLLNLWIPEPSHL